VSAVTPCPRVVDCGSVVPVPEDPALVGDAFPLPELPHAAKSTAATTPTLNAIRMPLRERERRPCMVGSPRSSTALVGGTL